MSLLLETAGAGMVELSREGGLWPVQPGSFGLIGATSEAESTTWRESAGCKSNPLDREARRQAMVGTTVYRRRADPGAQVTIEFDASQILNFDVRYVPRERDDEVEILIFRFRANEPGSTGWSYPGDRSALTGGAGVFHDGR